VRSESYAYLHVKTESLLQLMGSAIRFLDGKFKFGVVCPFKTVQIHRVLIHDEPMGLFVGGRIDFPGTRAHAK